MPASAIPGIFAVSIILNCFPKMFSSIIQLYREAYSGLSRKTWYLSLVMLINRSGTMVIPFMTIYCTQELHFSLGQSGIVMAFFGAGSIAGAFLGGRITDRLGFYPIQIGALLSGGILFLVVGYLHQFYSLCAGVLVLSICNESFRPANSTAIAWYCTPENRVRSYSLNRLAINLGFASGGALGGFIASMNYHYLFWVDGCTNIIAALLMFRLLPPPPGYRKEREVQGENARALSPYKDLNYLIFTFFVIVFATCFLQMFSVIPVFYKTQWGISERLIGTLMAVNGILIAAFEMIIVHNTQHRRPALFFPRIGALLLALGFAMINLLPHYFAGACVVTLLITSGEVLSLPFLNSFWLSRSQSGNRGRYAALYTIAWSTAQIAAPAMGAFIAEGAGFNVLWWVIAGMCLLLTPGFYFLHRRTEREPSDQ